MKILTIESFRINARIEGVYDGKQRVGTVVQVLENRVRVDVGNGFRMFSVDKLAVSSLIYTVDKESYSMEVRNFYHENGTETLTFHKDKF